MPHFIGFYVAPGFQLLDLAGPLGAFNLANRVDGRELYNWRVLSHAGGKVVGGAGVALDTARAGRTDLDTLLVAGGDIEAMLHPKEVVAVKALASKASRIASVCTAAFLLAEADLLDGRRATTHWSRARELQQSHPEIAVEADRIFVADGPVWTSAGVCAGIDLALALIEADHGIDLAREIARQLVVYHRRPGGQSQFSAMSQLEPASDRIRTALTFAREHLPEPLPLERLAAAVHLSPRQFERVFRRETGETPAKAVERLRVEVAYMRLQNSSEPVEVVARAVGFNDPERMRRAFIKRYGHPPQAIRRLARPLDGK